MFSPIPADSEARVPATREIADAAAGGAPPTPQIEGAAAEEGDAAVTCKLPLPTCPICMEPWTCNTNHRICCTPCGHVYGRSCLETWLHHSSDDGAKCPQCGEHFELKLITNLYAPGNLWVDGRCLLKELTAHCEYLTHKMEGLAGLKELTAHHESWTREMEELAGLKQQLAESHGEFEEIKRTLKDEKAAFAEFDGKFEELKRSRKEEKAASNAALTVIKERMKRMAEEENATATELIECVEMIECFCACSYGSPPVSAPPPGPAVASSKRRRRGT